MSQDEPRVVIGMDPHKRPVTIEVMAGDETILGDGRYATDEAGSQRCEETSVGCCRRRCGSTPPGRDI